MTVRAFLTIMAMERSVVFVLGQIMDGRAPCRVEDCDTFTQAVLYVWRFVGGM